MREKVLLIICLVVVSLSMVHVSTSSASLSKQRLGQILVLEKSKFEDCMSNIDRDVQSFLAILLDVPENNSSKAAKDFFEIIIQSINIH